jgi:hypothetical protein
MDTPGSEYGDYEYPDHDSGWGNATSGQMKFMAWALVLLVLAFVAFGLLVRWTSRPAATSRRPASAMSAYWTTATSSSTTASTSDGVTAVRPSA